MKIYLYCRVSTARQSTQRQIQNLLKAYPDGEVIEETWTGTTLQRPKFDKLLKKVKSGDKIVFDEVSRMSRDAEEGFQLYEELFNRGVELEFLKEPMINTETYKKAMTNSIPMTGTNVDFILEGINKYLLALAKDQIRLAFERSDAEVKYLQERTKEGIREAKDAGKQIGRIAGVKVQTEKSKKAKEQIKKFSKSFFGMLEDPEVIKICGVHRNTYYRYKREIKEELNQN